jgi:hypothetical protein
MWTHLTNCTPKNLIIVFHHSDSLAERDWKLGFLLSSFFSCVCVCVYVRDTTLAALFLIRSLYFFFGFVLHSCFCLSVFVQTFFVWLTGVSTYMLQSMSPPPPVAVTFVEKRTGQPCICWNGLSHDGMEIGS